VASGQMARLDQIFRQVGGSTLELTSDILHLAAVTGRSGEEAMESAISWSRLGLSRIQVNEAVRLSLMAANVTQMSAADTTEHLQAISQNYGLTVGQLASKLGEMVRISNMYNVTNADMLQGVSRSAAVAKQAGMSFEQLIGFIGATVGATKQTGANIGNAIKTIVTSLSSPALQEKLRMLYGIHSETPGGHARTVTDVLDDIYVRYQRLDALQSRAMTFSIGGKFQAQRLTALLDNYVNAQVLAIDAQLHLNTAEQENLKIVGALKAQLSGLSAEWERFVVVQGNNGPAQALGAIAKAMRGVISLMDTKGGSLLTTFMLGIGTAAIAKTALTAVSSKAPGGGWVAATQAKALEAAMALNGFTNVAMSNFGKKAFNRSLSTQKPPWYMGGDTKVGNALYGVGGIGMGAIGSGLTGMNQFGNARMKAAATAFQEMRLAAAAANGVIGLTVKSLALASAALVEFAVPIMIVVGGIYLFNKAMDASEGHAEASRKRLAGFNDEMERTAAAASAMGSAAKLFDTAIKTFAPMPGFSALPQKTANRMLDQLGGAMFLGEPDLAKRKKQQDDEVDRLKTLYKAGDTAGVSQGLESQRQGYFGAQSDQLQQNFEAKQRKAEELSKQYADLKKMQDGVFSNAGVKAWSMMTGGNSSRRDQMLDIQKQQADVNGEIVQSYQEQADLQEDILSTDQRVTAELVKQKALLEAVGAVFGSIHTNNPMEKWAVELTVAQAKLMALGKEKEKLLGQSQANSTSQAAMAQKGDALQKQEDEARMSLERLKMAKADAVKEMQDTAIGDPETLATARSRELLQPGENTEQGISRLKSQADSLRRKRESLAEGFDTDNPGAVSETARNQKLLQNNLEQTREAQNALAALEAQKALVQDQTNLETGQRKAGYGITASDYGANAGEKLVNQRNAITGDIAATEEQIASAERMGTDTLELKGRLLEDIYQKNKNTLDLLSQQAVVERDIKQLKADQNREFMRSMMGAGPAEMLAKIAAFRMNFNDQGGQKAPLSQGAFFALSPDMRANYGQLNPEFTPQMIELQNSRRTINNELGDIGNGTDGPLSGSNNPPTKPQAPPRWQPHYGSDDWHAYRGDADNGNGTWTPNPNKKLGAQRDKEFYAPRVPDLDEDPNRGKGKITSMRDWHERHGDVENKYGGWSPKAVAQTQGDVHKDVIKGFGVTPSGGVDAALVAGSNALQAVLATLPKGLTTAVSAVEDGATRVARALSGLAMKLENFSPGGGSAGFSRPINAQSRGLGGGRGVTA
jgi:TP901 family phage tail tape measure protein